MSAVIYSNSFVTSNGTPMYRVGSNLSRNSFLALFGKDVIQDPRLDEAF